MAYTTSQTLLTAATAVNSEPTVVGDGANTHDMGFPDELLLVVNSTAGSATMTVTIRMWGWLDLTSKWYPLGVGSDSTLTGIINDGNAIGENGVADTISHAEILSETRDFSRLYAEVTAIGGTATAVTVRVATRDPGVQG